MTIPLRSSLAIASASLVSFCLLSTLISLPASASTSTSASASIIVPTACTMSMNGSNTDHTYNVSMLGSQYKDDIGKTRLSVSCNDNGGFAVYTVGYSGNIFGNNQMLANNNTSNPNLNIPTGTATSGSTSQWAMKIEPASGSSPNFSILNNFHTFRTVPDSYTKIIEVPTIITNPTNPTNSSSPAAELDASYAIYISPTQPAGNYTGKVKYTLVHPYTDIPIQPYNTQAGKIGYYTSASEVVDSMSDQTPTTSELNDNSITLWPSNFKRPGYGFAGWSDKYDWELNQNDENGNGTGSNTGYHIYGPNQTITDPDTINRIRTEGLSLYAVWVKSEGYLQDWTGCSNMNIGEVTALTDKRDNDTYAVAKLKDGKCWMIENLRLGGTTAMTLDSTTTNLADGATFTLSASQDPTTNAWCTKYDNASCVNQSMLASNNTTNTIANMTTPSPSGSTGIYSYGNYYNWYSATAGTGTYNTSTNNASVASSICPKGWRLPTGGQNTVASGQNGDFYTLTTTLMGEAPNNPDSGYAYYQGTVNGVDVGAKASGLLRAYPGNLLFSGYVFASSVFSRVDDGIYWSSTATSSYFAYYLHFYNRYVRPGTVGNYKYYGFMARCVVGS